MADDLIERLEELIIADAFEAGHITSSMLAERLIKERAEAAARITALEAEVERLAKDRDAYMNDLHKELDRAEKAEAALAAKEAEIERKNAALDFYGWIDHYAGGESPQAVNLDRGKRARAALQEGE